MATDRAGGLALAAQAAAACRHLAAASLQHPPYSAVGAALLRRVDRLLGDARDLHQLDAANDAALRRIETCLLQLQNPTAPLPEPAPLPVSVPVPFAPAHLVARPQFAFSSQPDNSDTPWRPLLRDKPHALRPLEIEEERDADGQLFGYVHPYQFEIEAYKPPELFTKADKLPTIVIKDMDSTPFTYVDTEAGLDDLVRHLKTVKEIAVDLEHHSYRTFQGITCLVQISTEDGGDFIVDALSLRDRLSSLNESFADPNILKVFHGADMDVKWLQRDFGVYVVGMFDTHLAAIELDHPNKSLQAALSNYCNVTTDKTLRLSDWRTRPLAPVLLNYARIDTHYLLYIWRQMREELSKKPDRLSNVFERSKSVCSIKYAKQRYDPDGHLNLLFKSRRVYDSRQTEALRSLYKWRDEVARREDESAGYVLPNHMLLKICSLMPKEASGILACCMPTPPLLIQQLEVVYRLILDAAAVPLTTDSSADLDVRDDDVRIAFCPFVYDRQILDSDEPDRILPFEERIAKFPDVESNGSILTSRKEVRDGVDLESIVRSFAPPYERFLSIKDYLRTRVVKPALSTEKPANPDVSSISADVAKSVKAPIVEDETHILFNIHNSKAAKRPKIDPPAEESKAKSRNDPIPVQTVRSGIRPEAAKKVADDSGFKSFDYKNYNYNVYNKQIPPNKRKRKFRDK